MQSLTRPNPGDSTRPGARATAGTHRLSYMPALDGVRAFAVLAVMAYHGGLTFLPAGFFGVDAFFVLSGFLITTLLVTEWSGTGRIALSAFWARRARRLLPALLLMLVFVVLYARFVAAPGTYPGLRWDSIAALFYSANWRFIASGTSYFVQSGPVSPLLHTWSLAIEEQFYIVWPILVLAIVRVRRHRSTRALTTLLAVSVIGALASALEMALLFDASGDPTRVYFGTDTHAQCLLVGVALATGIALWRRRDSQNVSSGETASSRETASSAKGHRVLAAAGLLGIGACAWAWSQLHYGQAFVFQGGFLLVSVSVAAVIASAVLHPPGVVARGLSWAPLRYIGRISYGMYLWHFPLDIALTGSRTGLTGTPLFLVRTLVTVAVSTVSFYALERPIRTGAILDAARARIATPVAVIGTAVLVVVTTLPAAASGAVSSRSTTPATLPSGPGATVPPGLVSAPVRVMLVGDSVALSLGANLSGPSSRWHVDLENLATLGCGVAQGGPVWDDEQGQLEKLPVAYPCHLDPSHGYAPWPMAWPGWLRAVRPNVVVLLAGRWEVVDRTYRNQRTNILHQSFAAYVKSQLERAVQIGTSTGAHMVLMTAPCYDRGEQANGAPWPQDDIRRVEAYNQLVRQVGAEFPASVTVQDLYSLSCPQGTFSPTLDGAPLRDPDGIHFAITGATSAVLAPALLPLWEDLGHRQEAGGGAVVTGTLPVPSSLPYSADLPLSAIP